MGCCPSHLKLLELSNFGFIVLLVSSSSNQPGVAGMM